MTRGHLRDYFVGVGVKRLRAVDAEPKISKQHEIGTTSQMRQQFLHADGKERFKTIFVWLADDQDCVIDEGCSTHCGTRSNPAHRGPEWRLCYRANRVTELMRQGDALFLAMTPGRTLYFIVTPGGSTSQRQVSWLFGLSASDSPSTKTLFVSREVKTGEPDLDFPSTDDPRPTWDRVQGSRRPIDRHNRQSVGRHSSEDRQTLQARPGELG